MKIGLLTLPLYNNYGGFLQAYALKAILETMGHEVWLLRLESPRIYENWKLRLIYLKNRPINKLKHLPNPCCTRKEYEIIENNFINFKENHFPRKTPRFLSGRNLGKYIKENGFDGIVVGSDQVWRPLYTDIRNSFLSFCEDNTLIKRVAYAASFGVSQWEFTEKQTFDCRRLASLFDYISVREDSAVHLCREYLGINATHVLDPTMLLNKEDYIALIKKWNEPESTGDLFYYILDRSDNIDTLINKVESKTGLTSFTVYPRLAPTVENFKENSNECIFPRVTQWLRAFQDSKIVVTDSFHGCVFSIIFNVPFWCIGNTERGNARFDSLFKLFHLERRLIDPNTDKIDYNEPINWEEVNRIRNNMIIKSKTVFDYL